jgi:glycerophosphoryl diester phosphodiesterase
MRRWLRIAHRGASAYAPENTLAAFRRAVELGADAVEMDVHCTHDGEVVVLHDASLDRTTDRTGAVADLPFSEVRRASAGAWFSDAYRGERVPALREALDAIPPHTLAVVEIKAAAATLPVLRTIREAQRLDDVVVIAFARDVVGLARWFEPRASVALLVGAPPVEAHPVEHAGAMLSVAQALGTSILDVHWKLATPEAVWALHRRGATVWTWTANDTRRIRALVAADVDGIASDYPDRLAAVVEEEQSPPRPDAP